MGKQEVHDEQIYLRSAGVDLGKRLVVACVRTPSQTRPGSWMLATERFGTTPSQTRQLAEWLTQRQVEVVVLEATSDYWRPVYYTLQTAQLNLMLVNPAHLKIVRGRKTDPSDAAFLARAAASGMVWGSFVPDQAIRELRELTRRRTEITITRGQEIQRLEKELEDTGMKLSSVLSDLTGVSSRRILAALIAGERDPHVLADLAVRRARQKIPALIQALDSTHSGTFTTHHAWMCQHLLDQIDHLTTLTTQLDTRIDALLNDHHEDLANLATIPGISHTAAQIVIAETGGDMTPFATSGHLSSWIGVCPGMNESAGITKTAHTRPGNTHLKRILGVAAMAAIRNPNTYLAVFYRRTAARRGKQRALVAVMHKLAIAIWHVLHDKTNYHDLGPNYLTRRNPQRAMHRMTREANALGLTIRFDPIPTTATA